MLQQTRVEAVIPYFHRFMTAFPNLETLARARLQKVLHQWSGLGYYARARNLHGAAKIIWRELGGEIPSQPEELRKLPGFGPYTAGAVASLAFNRPVPAMDGNVERVIRRVFGEADVEAPPSKKEMERFWADWVPCRRASAFNQAMMDLGAMICVPGSPKCPECPVRKFCHYRGGGPRQPRTRKVREETWLIALCEKNARLLMHRKEGQILLAGLWQFPTVVLPEGGEIAGKRALKIFLRRCFGVLVKTMVPLGKREYGFTHIRAAMKAYLCPPSGFTDPIVSPGCFRWIKPSNLSRYPVSTAMRKVFDLWKESRPKAKLKTKGIGA